MKIKKIITPILIGLYLLFYSMLALTINYIMPSYQETIITDMEIRSIDGNDVYFLLTEEPESKKEIVYRNENTEVTVYRNEDTDWGLPLYFKFNSSEIQAKVQAYINKRQRVQIGYYGLEISWLSEFKNIVSIKPLKQDETITKPYVIYFFYLMLIIIAVLSIQLVLSKDKDP